MSSPVTIFVPRDSAARSVGADDVANAIANHPSVAQHDVSIVRNGSRGMLWLEPLVEVETAGGRVAYGPVTTADVDGLIEAGMLDGADHALAH